MKRWYTWKDVEISIEMERRHWPESWKRVDVYHDEIIVSKLKSSDHSSESEVISCQCGAWKTPRKKGAG